MCYEEFAQLHPSSWRNDDMENLTKEHLEKLNIRYKDDLVCITYEDIRNATKS